MKLLDNQMRQAEFDRNIYSLRPEHGTTLADVCTQEFWVHVAKRLKAGDRIEVMPVDGSWFAELYVRSANDKEVSVFVLRHVDFMAGEAPVESDLYEVKFAGRAKWRVLRRSDKEIMIDGLEKAAADDWVTQNTQKLAA